MTLCRFVAFLAAALLALPAFASEPDPTYLAPLLARARHLGLGTATAWLRLGHYRPKLTGGWQSQADGPAFFLAQHGADDPAAELDATLRAFFAPLPPEPTGTVDADRATAKTPRDPARVHPQCRFPARLLYLHAQLEFDPARLPIQNCPGVVEFWQRLQPRGISLVFSAYHLQAPASAFGHTFLRIDRAGDLTGGLELLDQGVDFSAEVDTGSSILYAWKGLTGQFKGRFHALPFYYKVREYNDFESRDLWQYHLNLAPDRLVLLVAHLWELGWTHFDYWYVSENCAYHVLGLLEAVLPHVQLLDRVAWPTIPGDTIRVAMRAGLVRSVSFRPSLRQTFRARLAGLDSSEQVKVMDLAEDPSASLVGLPPERQVRVLDAAADYLDARHAAEILTEADTPATRRRQALLARRSTIALPSETLQLPVPTRDRPDMGHATRRVALGGGAWSDGSYLSLDMRLALHDLSDPPSGYPELGQLEFLSGRLRFELPQRALRLDRVDLVRAALIAPLDRFQLRPSWEFRVGGLGRADLCPACMAGVVAFGGGAAVASTGERVALWALTWVEAQVGPEMRLGPAPAALAVGPRMGLRVRWTDRLVSVLQGELLAWPWQAAVWQTRAEAITRWQLGSALSLAADGRWDGRIWQLGGALAAYF